MNSRKYKSDINKLLEEGKAIMKSSENAKYLMCVFTVNMGFLSSPSGTKREKICNCYG